MQHNNDPVSLTQFLAQLCENQWAISEFQKLSLSKRGAKRSGKSFLTENEFCLHENKNFFHINGFALSLTCVASVSVRFRSKERGTRVKDSAKNDASKRAGKEWLSFHFPRGQNRKSRSSVFFCSETKRKRLLRRVHFAAL